MKTNELKCTDLRIGNLIDYFGDIIKVDVIDCFDGKERVGGKTKDGEHVYDKPSYFDPIELTEEVLLKIGFEKNKYDWWKYFPDRENGISILMTDNYTTIEYANLFHCPEDVTEVNYGSTLEFPRRIYIHQLQNAYYLLTNEELEVEL